MSLLLKKIELSNIRSHHYVNFEPSPNGITALSGPNGSGKSTIFDSMAWALYGTKPQGVSRAASIIRHGTDLSKEKCFARIWLQLGTSTIKVERRIVNKTGAVECELWEKAAGESDYTLMAGPSVSHAEPAIKKRLKLDEKGFLAAVLVQQKQVDQLISAGPKERAEVIEKLTGISSITAALTEARQHHNSLKKTLQGYTYQDNLVESIEKQVDSMEQDLEKRESKRDKLREQGSKIAQEMKEVVEKLRAEEATVKTIEAARGEHSTLEATITAQEGELKRATAMKDEKKKSLDTFSAGVNLREFEGELRGKRGELRNLEVTAQRATEAVSQAKESRERSQAIMEKAKVKDAAAATASLEKLAASLERGEEKRSKLLQEKAAAQGSISKLNSAISIIDEGDGHCPTCLQRVSDVAAAVASLRQEIATLEQRITSIDEELGEVDEQLSKVRESQRRGQMVLDAILALDEASSAMEENSRIGNEANSTITALTKEVEALEKNYARAKMADDVKREYESLLANAKSISDEIERGRGRLRELSATLKESKAISPEALDKLREKAQTLGEARAEKITEFSEAKEEASLLTRDLTYTREQLRLAREAETKYGELRESVEAAGGTVAVLEEFREERIKTSLPIVSAYASDLLSRFTDGKFTQLKLDKKFNASVSLANGVERPVGLLSGGELSSAAIALRLAISLLLNSGSSSTMLGLDEVLVSQDAERSELILTTIRDIFQGQLVIISHGPNTNEIADKVIEL